jgi:tripartite ATP-independent transporter DctP family solute receptor
MVERGSALSRRAFVRGVMSLGMAPVFVRSLKAAEFTFTQFHNQTEASSLHRRLVEMWAAVRAETRGRAEAQVFAENHGIEGSDPAALRMLMAGEIQFFTLMGGILGNVVPAADIQQVPFAFRSAADAHRAFDGPLGAHLSRELRASGIVSFPVSAFDNGMRQVACSTRPIVGPDDFAGLRIRVPDGRMFNETFSSFGAVPVTINVNGIYDGLKEGRVDAQENPLAVVELFHLDRVVKYVSLTNHMWSGFNLLAHKATWERLPDAIRRAIERQAALAIRRQRQDQERLNRSLRSRLAGRGLVFNEVDPVPFRARLSREYGVWRARIGTTAWSLLESAAGPLR